MLDSSILMCNTDFEYLVKKRRDWVRSSKENNFDFDSIFSGLYNDPSHFIYEIIQNAEDAKASEISFNLLDDQLEIKHNGKDFNFEDVDGITGIGISTKRDDVNKIGEFGVGFKSVFAITQSPIIESGIYNFQIDDFVVPRSFTLNGRNETIINLPFNHPTRNKEKVFSLVENKLQDIGLKTLLFLSHINEIKWSTSSLKGHYYKSAESVKNVSNVKKVLIISQKGDEECFEQYLVIDKPITISGKELKVEIAYKTETSEDGIEQIVSIPNQESRLVVYFPTEKVTYLNFIIQGPFKTTKNRENIPLDDEQNQSIIQEIANLVAESIPIIKYLKFLSTNFLQILPIEQDNCDEPIYSAIYEKVKEKFLSEVKLLPTNHGGYSHPNDSILARGKVLTKLLKKKDIQLLFDKSHWLDTEITYNRTREIRNYLVNELDVKEISFTNFCNNITEDFMRLKNEDWVIEFYNSLHERNDWDTLFREGTNWRTEGILRSKPIIRLKYNKHYPPFDSSDKIQVYLPTKTKSSYKIVKETIAENKRALEFFKKLGISKPDIFAEINEFILPKYKEDEIDINDDEYFEDIEKLITAISKKKSSEKREILVADLKDLSIIDAVNPTTGENCLMIPSEVYLNSDDLRFYFDGCDSVFFISDKLYKKFKTTVLEEFALKVGCNEVPQKIEIEGNLTWEEKKRISSDAGYVYRRTIYIKDYILDGFEVILNDISISKSILLWEFLLTSLNGLSSREQNEYFEGDYCWTPQSVKHHKYFDSKFKKSLCDEKWLFDKNGHQVKPSEIAIPDLPDDYLTEDKNIEVLESVLGFQLDEIKQIEEKTGGKFIPANEIDEYEEWKAERKSQTNKDTKMEEDWEPVVQPDEIETSISEGIFEPVVSTDLTNQKINGSTKDENVTSSSDNREVDGDDELNDLHRRKIGEWGEKYVFRYFSKNKYSDLQDIKNTDLGFTGLYETNKIVEVRWLNRSKDIGQGYDFVILENGLEIEYIEVKTTIKPDRTLHKITGTQWEFARRLYNEGKGDKYKIYVVKNADSHASKIVFISNPIKLWKEGALYAHPINFRL